VFFCVLAGVFRKFVWFFVFFCVLAGVFRKFVNWRVEEIQDVDSVKTGHFFEEMKKDLKNLNFEEKRVLGYHNRR